MEDAYKNPLKILIIVVVSCLLFVSGYFVGSLKLASSQPPQATKNSLSTEVSDTGGAGQKEIPVNTERVISKAPVFGELTISGLSPSVDALEAGKAYQTTFPSFSVSGSRVPITVTIKRATKYYPIFEDSGKSMVYFPSCSTSGCFDGKTFPVAVEPDHAIIAVDLEFKNSTTKDRVYFRGWTDARFLVDGEYLTANGSEVTQNISTYQMQRFTRSPEFYMEPLTTNTVTVWAEVPHDQQELTFIYGGNTNYNDTSFNAGNPSLTLPFHLTNITN